MTKIIQDKSLETKKIKSNFQVRLISALIMLVLLAIYVMLSVMYTEGIRNGWKINTSIPQYLFILITMFICGAMTFELVKILGIKEWYYKAIIIASSLLLFLFPMGSQMDFKMYQDLKVDTWYHWWQSLIAVFIFLGIIFIISKYSSTNNTTSKTFILFGALFLVIFGMKGFENISLSMISKQPMYCFTTILWIWMTIILTDSFAYIGGSKFGKTKLAPVISPKKTTEGAWIGTIVSVVISSIFALAVFYGTKVSGTETYTSNYGPFSIKFSQLADQKGEWLPGVFLVLLTFVVSVLGQAGDLIFSAIKRYANVKDYSKLIPGHGGILDRLDSFVFVFFFMFFIALALR